MAEIVGFMLKYIKSKKKNSDITISFNKFKFFLFDRKILGGIISQVTSLQGGLLVN